MLRFEAAYKFEVEPEYVALLTADFRFEFSADADSSLAAQYASSWSKLDENAAAIHLFEGFTSGRGEPIPGASDIVLDLNALQYSPDPGHPDSAAYFRLATAARVVMTVTVPGVPDTLRYVVDDPHDFHLVRGDAAVLDSDQPASSDRWYIRRWEDHSRLPTPAPGPAGNLAVSTVASTWGRLKAAYR
jgi:hypothetical protein